MSYRAKQALGGGAGIPDRWMAEISFLDDTPMKLVVVEELEDLDEIIERGPDWNTIDKIVITLNRPTLSVSSPESSRG